MAVTYISSDARTGGAAGEAGTGNTLTFTGVNAGAGDFLKVLAARRVTAVGNLVSGVTFGATGLIQQIQYNPYDGTNATSAVAVFYLLAPTGTDTLTVTYNFASPFRAAAYYVLSGVSQTAPFGTIFTKHQPVAFNAIGDNQPAAVDGLMIDCAALTNNIVSEDPVLGGTGGGTERHTVGQGTAISLLTGTAPGASGVGMLWSWTSNTDFRNYMMIPVNPAAGGGGVRVRSSGLLLGVG